jgi:hypothetical protein
MQLSAINRLRSLPAKKASFVEPMECLSVPRLPEGSQWLWEILCGSPHKISYVASGVMWRWDAVLARNAHGRSLAPHNSLSKASQELH